MDLINPIASLTVLFVVLSLTTITTQYKTLTIESDELCSAVKTRKVKLGKGPKSALHVTSSRIREHTLEWSSSLYCKFRVEPINSGFHFPYFNIGEKKNGVFAVIQHITLRRNESTGECIDYIQFMRSDGSTSQKFCGTQNAALSMDHIFAAPVSEDLISVGNSFDSRGDLEVIVFISRMALRPDEDMDLSIIFTAYRDCRDDIDGDMRPCIPKFPEKCIFEGFFHDEFINCPYPDCIDEGGCSDIDTEDDNLVRQVLENKILIGSISTLFIVFAAFVICLWACRKHKVLCWAEEFAHPSATPPSINNPPRVIEMNVQSNPAQSDLVAGATAPEEDKDPPPSYESLFPSR